jgi:DNA-binding transcriptional LysR family regulator
VGRNDVPWPIVIELRELRSVGALVEELHFGRAAGRLGVTPSTLSRRIVHLERELGVSLFVRTSRLDAALAAAQAGDDGGWEI